MKRKGNEMPKRIECPHCKQTDWITALEPDDYEADVEPYKQGFTHWCTYCLNMNWDDDADVAAADELFHFTVTNDGTAFKAPCPPQRPEAPANVSSPSLLEAMGLQTTTDDLAETDSTIEDETPSIDDTYADAPLLNQRLFDDVIEAARLKAGGIPTANGFKESDEVQPSRASRAVVWLFKAGAASGAGAGIVWAINQLLKGPL